MSNLGQNVARAVISAGLAPGRVTEFISALSSHNEQLLANIPGITPHILEQGKSAYLETYVVAFRHVWIAGGALVTVSAICKSSQEQFGTFTSCSLVPSGCFLG
jgi:hypothetical protein